MKWVDLYENTGDEGGFLEQCRNKKRIQTDIEQRKCGEQKGLETPVVHTVNDVHEFEEVDFFGMSECIKCTAWRVPPQGRNSKN